jgi:hypothetical protein
MKPGQDISLQGYNSFGINAKARHFAIFSNTVELEELASQDPKLNTLILGGGSNILFTKDFDGLVLKNDIKGIQEVPVPMSATTRSRGSTRANARARSASSFHTLRRASHSGATASKKLRLLAARAARTRSSACRSRAATGSWPRARLASAHASAQGPGSGAVNR